MLRYRGIWLATGWLWVSVVIYLSLSPHPPEPLTFSHADKLEHGFAYASLALWFAQLYLSTRQRGVVILLLVSLGITLEFLQGLSGYRMFEIADMLANSIGVLLGIGLAYTRLGRVLRELEHKFLR